MSKTTLTNITSEISNIISSNKSVIPTISEEERINRFLDSINSLKERLISRNEGIIELEKLFVSMTWIDITVEKDKILLEKVFKSADRFIKKSFSENVRLRRSFWKDNICRAEISQYQIILENLEETVHEVKQVFSLREDNTYNKMLNDLD